MFEVKGIPILADEMHILETLRDDVLDKLGKQIFYKMKRGPKNIMVCCPIHKDGQERKPSCGISTQRVGKTPAGTVHCFACGYKTTLDRMISDIFQAGDDGTFGRHWLMQNFLYFDVEKRKFDLDFDDVRKVTTKKYVSEQELQSYRFYHPYMFQRKLTQEVINLFDVGYDKNTNCITFPVRDITGKCLFVTKRSVTGKHFFIPEEENKPLYGIYECSKVNPLNELYVCESQINALTCWVYGKPAVALFGTGTETQIELLKNIDCRKLILALDPDNAGTKGTYKLCRNIKNKIIRVAQVPVGKDINDLSYEQFHNLNLIEIW